MARTIVHLEFLEDCGGNNRLPCAGGSTAERLDAEAGGFVERRPDDLRGLRVAVIAGTSSEAYLRRRQIDYIHVSLKDLLRILLTGRAQAVTSDALLSNETAVTEIKRVPEENIVTLDARCGLPE